MIRPSTSTTIKVVKGAVRILVGFAETYRAVLMISIRAAEQTHTTSTTSIRAAAKQTRAVISVHAAVHGFAGKPTHLLSLRA